MTKQERDMYSTDLTDAHRASADVNLSKKLYSISIGSENMVCELYEMLFSYVVKTSCQWRLLLNDFSK